MRLFRHRIAFSHFLVALLSVASLGALALASLDQPDSYALLEQQARFVQQLAALHQPRLLRAYAVAHDLRIRRIGPRGVLLWDSSGGHFSEGAQDRSPGLEPEVLQAWSGQSAFGVRQIPPERRLPREPATIPMLIAALPDPDPDHPEGGLRRPPLDPPDVLLITRSLLPETLERLGREETLVEIALASLALGAVLSWALARAFSRPLEQAIASADRLAEGDLAARMRLQGPQELVSLGMAFNQMASQLEQRDLSLHQFAQDASHELRTPLSSLRALLEALQAGAASDPERGSRFLELLLQETTRLERLVGDLLDLQRTHLERREVALSSLLAEVALPFGATLQLPVEPSRAWADPDRLWQVLLNLLDNARRAGGRRPIEVGARRGQRGWLVWVQDYGVGIPPHERERIFERFARLDPARASRQGGSGLGLAICRSLVRAHGGRIWAEGEPGQTRICFTLPDYRV